MGDNQLTLPDGGRDVEQFDPERYRLNQAVFDYTIAHAKRIKDWPALEKAIDIKIDEQGKFIGWRKAHIRGVGQPAKNGNRSVTVLSEKQITDLTGITKMQATRIATKLAEVSEYRKYLLGAEYRAAFFEAPDNVRGTAGTGEFERYTPSYYIETVRMVLGEIDLDPASSEIAQKTVKAAQYFTSPIQIRSATRVHRRHGGVRGGR
jgi:hypothetical protein